MPVIAALLILIALISLVFPAAANHPCAEPVYPWSDTYLDVTTGKMMTLPGRPAK